MQTSLLWQSGELAAVLGVGLTTLIFLIYQLASESSGLKAAMQKRLSADQFSYRWVRYQKILGFVLMGLIPWMVAKNYLGMSDESLGLAPLWPSVSYYWVLGCAALIIPLNLYNARKPDNLAMYPQVRLAVWPRRLVYAHIADWTLYLLGYEFLFRGFLLATCLTVMGPWTAIVVNIAMYSLSHLPKGMKEALGAIPLGIVVCVATLQTGAIWVAFVIHLILAVANFLSSLAAHPDMRVEK